MGRKSNPLIKKTIAISITLREDVIEWADRLAAVNNRTRSNVINSILLYKMSFGTEIEIAGGLQKVILPPKGNEPGIIEDKTNEENLKKTQQRIKEKNKGKVRGKGRPKRS